MRKISQQAVCCCYAALYFAYVGRVTDSSHIRSTVQLLTSKLDEAVCTPYVAVNSNKKHNFIRF